MLQATKENAGAVTGYLSFVQLEDGNLNVTVMAQGLLDGDHSFHVHTYGDVSSNTGMATGGHFIGDCNECRPSGQPQEVGLLNNGTALSVSGGQTSFWFVETVAKLSGVNSIEGRAIIIHGNSVSSSARVAQCVIGRQTGNLTAPSKLVWVW